jgi:beta-xylosidase
MHLATSDDLINWTKVQNDQPLFTRGPHGAWDQGAIWPTAIFEYKDKLYLYYEAWGREGFVADRDQMYFRPAGSMVGVAVVEKDEFLKWCGIVD